MNAVVSMPGKHGFVIVTSRAGSPQLWSRKKLEQNHSQQPLSQEDAIYVLWRLKESIDTTEESDSIIKEQVERFKEDSPDEFRAL